MLQVEWIRNNLLLLCKTVRKDAVPLVDAWNIPDGYLHAPFGAKDGNIYTHYFNLIRGP
jgi:acyl-CoA oxidase